jgi:hypothetical protein
MAGKIIADTIQAAGSYITLNVGNVTILTANSTGLTITPSSNLNFNVTNSIWTASPGSNSAPSLTFSGNTSTGIFFPSTNTVAISTAATEALRVDSGGNVGIGTSDTSTQRLKVKQSADTGAASFSFKVEANANDTGLFLGYRGVGAASAADTCAILASYTSTGAYKPLTFLTSDAERMRIDSSGNVGIGSASPSAGLDVTKNNGIVLNTTNSYSGITMRSAQTLGVYNGFLFNQSRGTLASPTASQNGDILGFVRANGFGATVQGNGNTQITYYAADNFTDSSQPTVMAFGTTASGSATQTERMRIDSSGNLLVGTTSVVAGTVLTLKNPSNATVWGTGPNSSGSFLVYNASSVGVYLGSGSTAWSSSSDERIKTAITPFENALEKVCTLRAGTGRYLKDEETVSRSFLIAQDVQAVLPEAVNVQNDEIGTLGLQYTDVIPLLVAAIQELKVIVDAQAVEIAALKAK